MDNNLDMDVEEQDIVKKQCFPFQIQTQIVKNSKKCPIQKKLENLNITNFETYDLVIKLLKDQLLILSQKKSENSKLKHKQLKTKLNFLELNQKYIAELAKTFLEPRSYTFIEKKNINFLYYSNSLTHLKKVRGLVKFTSVYFYPNLLATYFNETQSNGRPVSIATKVKSSSGKLVLSQLRFLYVDIDGAISWETIASQIKNFGLPPDVVVQTSENSFHLYWSIHHVDLDTQTEDKKGNQLDKKLILYELTLKALISTFNADKARSNASSLMRMPNTWNIKPHKNKKFKAHYFNSPQTLEQSLQKPAYSLDLFINKISETINPSIYEQADTSYNSLLISPPELDEVSTPEPEQIQNHIETIEKKVEFDFSLGWENSFVSLCEYFKVPEKYFTDNDVVVLKHMWTYRLCGILNFPESIRLSLKGSGNKYSELKMSIEKIGNLPRKITQTKNPLIFIHEPYKKPTGNQAGKRNGYKVSPMFLEACGKTAHFEKTNWLERISQQLYKKGNRNNSIPYDCFILSVLLGKSLDESRQFLIDKIERSANQTIIEQRCSPDTSNVDSWLRYYYK